MPDGNLGNQYRRKNRHRVIWHAYDGVMYYVTICTKDKEHYLGEIVDGVMNFVGNWQMFARTNCKTFSWQFGFYDHIIRDSAEMSSIAEYIENNVANWNCSIR